MPKNHLSFKCLFPPLVQAFVAGAAFIPVPVTYIIFLLTKLFKVFRSGNLTHLLLKPGDQGTLCIVATSILIFDYVFTTTSPKTCVLTLDLKESVNTKTTKEKWLLKGRENDFLVKYDLFSFLIGPLASAVWMINSTIQLKRWVLVLPTTDRIQELLRLLCESWSRKWIGISFNGHERLLWDSVVDYNWDTRVYSLSGQTLMVSALRRMIEESHTLTVEVTVNQKRWLFSQLGDCCVFTLHSAWGLPSLISGESTLQRS